MDHLALAELLNQSRKINKLENITGVLLYKDGSFAQILEGRADNVDKIYRRIKRDTRHVNVKLLYRDFIDRRDFPDWTMGFQNLDAPDFKPPEGFTDFMRHDYPLQKFIEDPSRARKLMLFFRAKS